MIKAVFFDVDGTILDTTEFIFQSFHHTLLSHAQKEYSREELIAFIGPPLEDTYGKAAPHVDTALLVETHRSFQEKNLHLSKPFEKTLETLTTLHKKGIKLAAITNRTKRTSHDTMKLAAIHHFFELIISAEDVKEGKPHPEGIQTALAFFNLKPEEAIMVGDTHADVEAARAAGVQVVGTTQGMKGDDILKFNPDYVIHDISELLKIIE